MGNSSYRLGCGAVIFNREGKILVGQRSKHKKTAVGKWQLPQGGVSATTDDEKLAGIYRELHEEIGLDGDKELKLVKQFEKPLQYDYPQEEKKFSFHRGQSITYFVFHWPNADLSRCKLDNEPKPEFDRVGWMSWDELLHECPPFKVELYKRIQEIAMPVIIEYLRLNC